MKILEIATSTSPQKVYNDPNAKRGSGYDFMTYEIAKHLAKIPENSVDFFTIVQFHKKNKIDNITLLQNELKKTIFHFSPYLFLKSLILLRCYFDFSRNAIRDILYESVLAGYYRWLIKKGHYDVIHVHGCIFSNEILKYIAKENDVKIVFTLHGLNSVSKTTNTYNSNRKYERDFLRECYLNNQLVSFVSSGCIKSVHNILNISDTPSFRTILNGCEISSVTGDVIDIRARYNIPDNSFILLYVGNISKNKNQEAVVHAFDLMDADLLDRTYILFLGGINNAYRQEWASVLDNSKYRSHFIECGFISKSEIHNYYSQSNGNILISVVEGFGLSIIESMSFGKPSIVDMNMDIASDINDDKIIKFVDRKSPVSIVEGIQTLLRSEWNGKYMVEQAQRFSFEQMAIRYMELLKS